MINRLQISAATQAESDVPAMNLACKGASAPPGLSRDGTLVDGDKNNIRHGNGSRMCWLSGWCIRVFARGLLPSNDLCTTALNRKAGVISHADEGKL